MILGNKGGARGGRLEAFRPRPEPMVLTPATRIALFALALALPPAAAGADTARGQALYEARCDTCHAESVHGRAKREAKDWTGVRGWVARWSGNLGLKWTAEEIDDVTAYLNGRYYRYACPPSRCPATGRGEGGGQLLAAGPVGAS